MAEVMGVSPNAGLCPQPNKNSETRMSNKVYPPSAAPEATREFRMMKFIAFECFLRRSLFVIRPARYALKLISSRFAMPMSVTVTVTLQSASQGRRVFCGSLLNFFAKWQEVSIQDPGLVIAVRAKR